MTDPVEPPPPTPPPTPGPPPGPPSGSASGREPGSGFDRARGRALVPVIAVAVVVVLVVAGTAAIVRFGSSQKSDPRSATVAYYGALIAHRTTPAFDLLCAARRQQMGLELYAHTYAADVSTGTGVHTWSPRAANVQGANATVPGTLMLDDKEQVPITILVVRESGTWKVCSSDLGGVLPNPGGASNAPGGVTT